MWKSTTLSNGVTIQVQQNLCVRSLIDVQREWRKGSFMKIRKGDICLVRQEPCGAAYAEKNFPDHTFLALGKETSAWSFRELKKEVKEGVDFEVIEGAIPYPPIPTEEELEKSRKAFTDFMNLFS
jgi:hypothetical protein